MEILKESEVQKEKFRVSANKLLNSCFILKKKEDTKKNYNFILQNKELFIEYFDLLGYELNINESLGVISLINANRTGRLKLRKIESIILLILRLLYIEKHRELRLNEEVIILSSEIHDKYNMLKIEAKPNIDKTTFRDTLKLFKKYNLIYNIDKDVALSECRIKIYSSILFAISDRNINEFYDAVNEKLNIYVNGGENIGFEKNHEEEFM